ncbi:MAG: hypothetical protein HC904_00290 [Blastochloris sp.]|nr:hypothetical protein [Blastochloris sp.]
MFNKVFDWLYHYASFLPGIGLTIGYIGAVLSEPTRTATFVDHVAHYEEQEIGIIPKWHHETKPPRGFSPVIVMQPKLDSDGQPVIRESQRTVKGKGVPTVYIKEKKEIFVSELSEDKYTIRRIRSVGYLVERDEKFVISSPRLMTKEELENTPKGGIRVHYLPNIHKRSTGVYEVYHDVSWDVKFDPNSVSIWFAIAGTVSGVLIFHLRPMFTQK